MCENKCVKTLRHSSQFFMYTPITVTFFKITNFKCETVEYIINYSLFFLCLTVGKSKRSNRGFLFLLQIMLLLTDER